MTIRIISLALAAVVFVSTAWAHHNMTAIYNLSDVVKVNGTLTKVDWRNPHIELDVEMKNGTQVQTWALEGPPPSFSACATSTGLTSKRRSTKRFRQKPAVRERDLTRG